MICTTGSSLEQAQAQGFEVTLRCSGKTIQIAPDAVLHALLDAGKPGSNPDARTPVDLPTDTRKKDDEEKPPKKS